MKMEWVIAGVLGLIAILYLVSKAGTSSNPLNGGSFAPGVSGEGGAIDGALASVGTLNSLLSGNDSSSLNGADFDDSEEDY